MSIETYKGRRMVVRTRKGRDGRQVYVTVNGVEVTSTYYSADAADRATAGVRATIDFIDLEPVDGGRWGIEWYDPRTVKLCPEGVHAMAIGADAGAHPSCVERNSGPKAPCPKCGRSVARYRPIGVGVGPEWVVAHRAAGNRDVCPASDLPGRATPAA